MTIVEATSKGGLTSARAVLSGSTAGVGSAAAQIAAARAAVARADADVRKAEIDLNRARMLRKAEAIPQERLDGAQLAYEAAKAAKAEADAQVALAEDARRGAQSRVVEARGRLSQSTPVAPQIDAARAGAALAAARVRSAEAALTLARLQLDYTRIVAPADGFASKLTVHDGQLVALGQPLVEVVPDADLRGRELQGDADRPHARRPAGDGSTSTRSRAASSRAGSRASPAAPAPASRCCRPTTRPATS